MRVAISEEIRQSLNIFDILGNLVFVNGHRVTLYRTLIVAIAEPHDVMPRP